MKNRFGKIKKNISGFVDNNKMLSSLFVIEIVILGILLALAFKAKLNSTIVSPPLDYWQSRYASFDNGYIIEEDDIDKEDFSNGHIDFLFGPYMNLKKGGYTYSIEYNCDENQLCFIHAFEAEDAVKDSIKTLKSEKSYSKGHFIVTKDVDNLELRIQYIGKGALSISNITVVSSPYNYYYRIAQFIIAFLILDLLIYYWKVIVNELKLILFCVNNRVYKVNKGNERSDGIDFLKLLAAFLVINVHMPFEGICGDLWLGICRCATPMFFVISGYYYTSVCGRGRDILQLKRVIRLIIYSNLLYYFGKIIIWKLNILDYTLGLFNVDSIKWLVYYNKSPFEYHLWYLNAILYVLLIFYIAWQNNIEKFLIYLSPILLIIGLSIGQYARIIWNREIYHVFSRGFLFEGIPFFAIGLFLYRLNCRKSHRSIFWSIGVLFGALLTIIEIVTLKRTGLEADGDLYIGTVFMSCCLVMCFANFTIHNNVLKILALFGRKYSSNIYIVHVLIIHLWNMYFKPQVNSILYYFGPIIIFLSSLILVIIIDVIKRKKYVI